MTHPLIRMEMRGEELFCEGINHFVLHVYVHQTTDGVPGKNPSFGTAFHRNNPWFNEAQNWVRYLQRCHTLLQQGEPVADVAVYIGDFAPQMTGPVNPVPTGYDYDYVGSDATLRVTGMAPELFDPVSGCPTASPMTRFGENPICWISPVT